MQNIKSHTHVNTRFNVNMAVLRASQLSIDGTAIVLIELDFIRYTVLSETAFYYIKGK